MIGELIKLLGIVLAGSPISVSFLQSLENQEGIGIPFFFISPLPLISVLPYSLVPEASESPLLEKAVL